MTKLLLSVLIAGSLAAPVVRGEAADRATAYAAMRLMGKSLGEDTINRVVEVTGRGGTPQPETWRIVILDGAKGAREVQVAAGRVVSQKTVGPTALRPIRLQDLNLDSSGAFDAANTQARKARVPFTAVDYVLRVNADSGKPAWNLELFNAGRARVGGVRLAAHDGNLIAVNGLTPGPSTSTVRPLASNHDADHDTVRPTRVAPSRSGTTTTTTTTYNTVRTEPTPRRNDDDDDERRDPSSNPSNEGGFFSRAGRTLDHTTDAVGDSLSRTGHAVDRTVRRTGAKIQRFFTGNDSNQSSSRGD